MLILKLYAGQQLPELLAGLESYIRAGVGSSECVRMRRFKLAHVVHYSLKKWQLNDTSRQ